MTKTGNTRPERIVDKNGRETTVHKKVVSPAKTRLLGGITAELGNKIVDASQVRFPDDVANTLGQFYERLARLEVNYSDWATNEAHSEGSRENSALALAAIQQGSAEFVDVVKSSSTLAEVKERAYQTFVRLRDEDVSVDNLGYSGHSLGFDSLVLAVSKLDVNDGSKPVRGRQDLLEEDKVAIASLVDAGGTWVMNGGRPYGTYHLAEEGEEESVPWETIGLTAANLSKRQNKELDWDAMSRLITEYIVPHDFESVDDVINTRTYASLPKRLVREFVMELAVMKDARH